jgi:transposase
MRCKSTLATPRFFSAPLAGMLQPAWWWLHGLSATSSPLPGRQAINEIARRFSRAVAASLGAILADRLAHRARSLGNGRYRVGGAPIHRSALVKNHVAFTQGRIVIERLPAYAPELNPVEYMWGQLKTHEIANLIATKAWELSFEATAALRRMRRRRSIIAACYTQADLWP